MALSKRLICFIMALMLAFAAMPVFAKTKAQIQAELNEKNKEKQEIQERIDELEKEGDSILDKKNVIDAEIDGLNVEIAALQSEIDDYDSLIAAKEAEIAAKQEEIDVKTDVFHKRVRVMYENKNTSYLEVLLTSDSFSDFLLKLDLVKEILSYDKDILNELEAAKAELNEAKAELEDAKESIESAKSLVDEKKYELQVKSDEQQSLIDEIEQQKKMSEKELAEVEAAESSLREEIRKLEPGSAVTYTGGAFTWPVPGYYRVSSPYGMRVHPVTGVYKMHTGIDIPAPTGTPVLAAADGTVIVAGWNTAYGNVIVVSHGNGLTTLYGHNSSLKVSKGQSVSAGQTIALVGSTGWSTGAHLHFEVSINGSSRSPWNYLS